MTEQPPKSSEQRGLTEAEKASIKSLLRMAAVFFTAVTLTAILMAFITSQINAT